jgi:hypothetical protein
MKVELSRGGTLVIGPETSAEEYALLNWAMKHAAGLPEELLVITDKDIGLIEAAEMDEEEREILEDERNHEFLANGPARG